MHEAELGSQESFRSVRERVRACLVVLAGTSTLSPLELHLGKKRGIYAACLAFIGGVNILKGTFIIKTLEHHLTVSRARRARASSLPLCLYENQFSF